MTKIVCPSSRDLLASFSSHRVALRVDNPQEAMEAAAQVWESDNQLQCVLIDSASPLADLDLQEDLKAIPMAVMAPAMGNFRLLAKRLDFLRACNLRVYLSANQAENLVGLRILSSLGIHSGAVLESEGLDWEALADLMTYAVLERVPHAAIEPFTFIASNYDPSSYLKWGAIFFDDPQNYLHLDAEGRVALSRPELINQQFIAQSLAEIKVPAEFPAIRERVQAWRHYFVDNHPCASCGAWKICLGKFAAEASKNQGCAGFFLEMMEVARQFKNQQRQAEEFRIWQP